MAHLNAGEPHDSRALDGETEVICPYCGETVTIVLDPASGPKQDYVEDCGVCCRPWQVTVRYDETGAAEVQLERAQ